MTHDEDRAELQKRPLAWLRRCERDNDRAADGYADRVAADEQTRLRDADVETGRDVRQQAHNRKLGCPDGERRKDKREQQRRHGCLRRSDLTEALGLTTNARSCRPHDRRARFSNPSLEHHVERRLRRTTDTGMHAIADKA
jgi:hypothetical protein